MPWTVAGAGEAAAAAAAAEGLTVSALGPVAAVDKGTATGALGLAAMVAPEVEVSAGGVELLCTRGR